MGHDMRRSYDVNVVAALILMTISIRMLLFSIYSADRYGANSSLARNDIDREAHTLQDLVFIKHTELTVLLADKQLFVLSADGQK